MEAFKAWSNEWDFPLNPARFQRLTSGEGHIGSKLLEIVDVSQAKDLVKTVTSNFKSLSRCPRTAKWCVRIPKHNYLKAVPRALCLGMPALSITGYYCLKGLKSWPPWRLDKGWKAVMGDSKNFPFIPSYADARAVIYLRRSKYWGSFRHQSEVFILTSNKST